MLVTIISDSYRHGCLADELKRDGFDVELYDNAREIPERIEADIIVLPIPTVKADGLFNLGMDCLFTTEDIIDRTKADSHIITCNYECKNRKFTDINRFEPFTSMNAVPSAEGAIFEAMKNSDIPLFGSQTLVTGYGRIGKIIAHRMKSFCSEVTVAARNVKDIYSAQSLGYKTIDYARLDENVSKFDFLFQTVPFPILTDKVLINTRGLIIELSSKCAGTDSKFAKANSNRLIYCPGIPEKYSKEYAAKIFSDSVKNIIKLNT